MFNVTGAPGSPEAEDKLRMLCPKQQLAQSNPTAQNNRIPANMPDL
jgi:hypothetical protein